MAHSFLETSFEEEGWPPQREFTIVSCNHSTSISGTAGWHSKGIPAKLYLKQFVKKWVIFTTNQMYLKIMDSNGHFLFWE